jgi:hypothetical protein
MSHQQHKREREREREKARPQRKKKKPFNTIDKKMIQREREDAPHHQNKKREHAPSNKTHTKSFIFKAKSELLSQQPDGGLEPTPSKRNNAVHHQGK